MNQQRKNEIISERIGHLARLVAWVAVDPWKPEDYTEASTRDGKPTAFMYISGHVRSLSVQVHEDGWDNDRLVTFEKVIPFDELADPQNKAYGELVEALNDFGMKRHGKEGSK